MFRHWAPKKHRNSGTSLAVQFYDLMTEDVSVILPQYHLIDFLNVIVGFQVG